MIYGGEYGKEGTRGVNLAVMRQPGSNTIEVTDNIKALLPVFQAQMPPSVHLAIRGDRSKNIREAFQDIQFTMAGHAGAGDPGDFPVPAELLGHHDPGDGAAVLDRRHVLGDVPAGFQPEQHLA